MEQVESEDVSWSLQEGRCKGSSTRQSFKTDDAGANSDELTHDARPLLADSLFPNGH